MIKDCCDARVGNRADRLGFLMGPLLGQDASGEAAARGRNQEPGGNRAALLSVGEERGGMQQADRLSMVGRDDRVWADCRSRDVEGKDTFLCNKAGERMWWALERVELEWKGRKIGGDR